tara:strand:+ start:215 stop:640 length:426 start_codon:yes stop_codon:yes gene_type:complete
MNLTETKLKELIEEILNESKKGKAFANVKNPWVDHIAPVLSREIKADLGVEVTMGRGRRLGKVFPSRLGKSRTSRLVIKAPSGAKYGDIYVVWRRYDFAVTVEYSTSQLAGPDLQMRDFNNMNDFIEAILDAVKKLAKNWR